MTMATKPKQGRHSPEPWRLRKERTSGYELMQGANIIGADGRIICTFNGAAALGNGPANAALIVSAPDLQAQRDELLAVCRELADVQDWCAGNKAFKNFCARYGYKPEGAPHVLRKVIAKAKAAIAHAEKVKP
jgi:hypothetical protein